MSAPKVTVVVLNWNGWADTLRCLASLQTLEAPAPHIVLVDNHSSDGSVAKIRQVFPALEILETPANLGFGGGCNVGMRHALAQGADYIWLVNSDATVEPKTLSAMLQLAEHQPKVGAVGSVIYELTEPERVELWGGGQVNLWLGRSRPLEAPGTLAFVSGASMLLRARALQQVGLFDDQRFFMYWEDTDLGFRLRQHGWRLATATGSRVWHKGSGSLGKGSPQIDAYFVCSALRFFRQHAPWPALASACLVASLLAKRLLLGQWPRVQAVWRGLRAA